MHGIGAAAAVDEVVAAVAEDRVGESIAEALQAGAALQHQRLHVVGEPIVDRGEHRAAPVPGALDHGVGDIVDKIGVVAETAGHDVGTGSAVDQVVASVAEDRVC